MPGMNATEVAGLLDFLRAAESLKTVTRSAYTSQGRAESVAEHTWRLSLMALLLAPEFPEVDFARLIKICLVHDLGEAIGGDIPAPGLRYGPLPPICPSPMSLPCSSGSNEPDFPRCPSIRNERS